MNPLSAKEWICAILHNHQSIVFSVVIDGHFFCCCSSRSDYLSCVGFQLHSHWTIKNRVIVCFRPYRYRAACIKLHLYFSIIYGGVNRKFNSLFYVANIVNFKNGIRIFIWFFIPLIWLIFPPLFIVLACLLLQIALMCPFFEHLLHMVSLK